MRCDLKEEKLILYLEGELNSYNAEGVEREIDNTLKDKKFKNLVLNMENLRYISSAGLRIILKLKQKYGDVVIEDASLEVYDILQMTGFTNIMDVKKALKRVYVSGAEVIGEGFFSTVTIAGFEQISSRKTPFGAVFEKKQTCFNWLLSFILLQ